MSELPIRNYTPESELAHPGRLWRDIWGAGTPHLVSETFNS